MGRGVFILFGSIVLLGGSYLAARIIVRRFWNSFIEFGERRYQAVYGETRTTADETAGGTANNGQRFSHQAVSLTHNEGGL